jgi:ribose transport system permease protein
MDKGGCQIVEPIIETKKLCKSYGTAQVIVMFAFIIGVLAAVVVGGTSLNGGEGSIVGTFFGALIIGVVNNTLNLMNVDAYWQQVVLGSVILSAVLLDKMKNQRG